MKNIPSVPTSPNRALWLSALVALFGFFSYFFIWARWPWLRDTAVLSYLILGAAAVLASQAVRTAHRTGRRRVTAWVLWLLPPLLTLALYLYCGPASRLPAPSQPGLAVGAEVPRLFLSDESGRPIELQRALGARTLIVFYRGSWCLFCRSELADFEAHRREFARLGTTLIGISSEQSEGNRELRAKLGLNYPLLSDPDLKAIDTFGVRHEEGEKRFDFALPALFLLRGRQVEWRDVSSNYRLLPHAADVLERIRSMQ
jgi:peroxiredoxin